MYQIVNVAPPPPSRRRPGLDPGLERICLKAMAKDPGRRYASGDEMAAALSGPEPSRVTLPIPYAEAAARSPTRTDRRTTLPPPLPPTGRLPNTRRKGAGWKWALGACALLVAVGLAGAAVYWWPPLHPTPAPTDGGPTPVATTTVPPSNDGKKPDPIPNPKNGAAPPVQGDLVNSFGMKLKAIPAGHFLMGSAGDRDPDDEKPQHPVDITRPFYLGVYPVTQGEYVQVTGEDDPSWFGPKGFGASVMADTDTTKCPVEEVSWDGASAFCEMLNKKDAKKPSGWKYGLPTEAQWEYACRAGTKTAYSFGDDAKNLGDYAWSTDNSAWRTHPVGVKKPNPWGLYDMHGNVFQWCADWYAADYYRNGPAADPKGPPSGDQRVLRGGSWNSARVYYCSAARYQFAPAIGGVKLSNSDIGFRVCLVQEP